MPTASTTPFGPDFVRELILWFIARIGEETARAYRMMWDAIWPFVLEHRGVVIGVLLFILFLSAFEAFTTGRWGWFGSVLYNYLYFGALIIIGFIFGPEIYANDYFKIVLAILYVICFTLVGKVLRKTNLKRY